jgi:hypothetical protein
MNLFVRASALATVVLALTGCASTPRPDTAPTPVAAEWTTTLAQVAQEVQASRYAVAERLLAEFATRHVASPEAVETIYWRALFRLDPANPAASPREASALLDSYLASPVPGTRRLDATVIRRIAGAMEVRLASAAAGAAAAAAVPTATDKAKDEELARVKDELAKANAELDRIRRRLAQPKP